MESAGVVLDPTRRSVEAQRFEATLQERLVGQPDAVAKTAQMVQTFMAGFNPTDRPAGVMLMLGPTGTGKTKLVETVAEILFGTPKALFKIACAEYQDSYQTNRLLGAPPGYIGYTEGKGDGLLSQEKLDRYQTPAWPVSLVLFDEIEKAHERLFDVMLNILDKGEMTTSNGVRVDFTRCLIFMTSNLGASELGKQAAGFTKAVAAVQARNDRKAIEAAVKNRFKSEFLNRIDHQVFFQSLQPEHLRHILTLEVNAIRRRLMRAPHTTKFTFLLTPAAEHALIVEGFNAKFGARHLKRVLEQRLVQPLANLTMSDQIAYADQVVIDYTGTYQYRKFDSDEAAEYAEEWPFLREALAGDPSTRTMKAA